MQSDGGFEVYESAVSRTGPVPLADEVGAAELDNLVNGCWVHLPCKDVLGYTTIFGADNAAGLVLPRLGVSGLSKSAASCKAASRYGCEAGCIQMTQPQVGCGSKGVTRGDTVQFLHGSPVLEIQVKTPSFLRALSREIPSVFNTPSELSSLVIAIRLRAGDDCGTPQKNPYPKQEMLC